MSCYKNNFLKYKYIYTHTHIRDGSLFSNIQLVDLIIDYSLGCAIIFKGVPTLGVLNPARARLSPKALFVWLMWSLRAALGRGAFSRPWLGCKKWARERFRWTRARHTCSVSVNRAGAWNFWYVQPDFVNNRPVKQYIVRGTFVAASLTTQNNKPQS